MTMELVLGILGSGVLSTLISCIFQARRDKKQEISKFKEGMNKLEKGLGLVLLSTLKRDGDILKAQGNISKNEYDSFEATYQAYKSLGGDGWADDVRAEVEALEKNLND